MLQENKKPKFDRNWCYLKMLNFFLFFLVIMKSNFSLLIFDLPMHHKIDSFSYQKRYWWWKSLRILNEWNFVLLFLVIKCVKIYGVLVYTPLFLRSYIQIKLYNLLLFYMHCLIICIYDLFTDI